MTAATVLLVTAAVLWVIAAAVSAVFAAAGSGRGLIATALSSAAAGIACLAGGVVVMAGRAYGSWSAGAGQVVGGLSLRTTGLASTFIALLGLIAVAIGRYAWRYHQPGPGTAAYLAAYNLALLASLGVLVAANLTTFLVAWESMALLCYFLVVRHGRRRAVAGGAFWFLALSEVGFGFIVAALVILAVRTGSLDLATIAERTSRLSNGWRGTAFVLALIGFGFKAGLVPLHVWLPEAHPVAPADGSAFLSGLVVNLGVYGIALVGFDLLAGGPAWWGLIAMLVGALSAVIGILYALTERDIKRFLAFSTIENVGVIVVAIGAGMTFAAYQQAALASFLLLAALFHVVAHGTSKTLLFLEAGVVEHATGTRDMDRLGGLVKRLPRSAVVTLVGTVTIAALPPFGGFVSEWLIFQGLFQGFRIENHVVGILIVVAAACLGLTGGLAINAFVRAFGIPYLGMPRTKDAAGATERHVPVAGPGLLAAVCLGLGIGAPLVVTALSRAVTSTTGTPILADVLVGQLTIIPAHPDFSGFSPTYLAIFLVAMISVPVVIFLAGRPRGRRRIAPVWDGGIVAFKPRMQYSAMTFSAPVRVTFAQLYQPTVAVDRTFADDPAGRSGPVHYESRVTPVFTKYLYQPVVSAITWLAKFVAPIQSGDVNLYLLYVFLAALAAYLVAAL